MSKNRQSLLEQKRQEIELELRNWVEGQQLLKPGEQLKFELTISGTIPVVVGVVKDLNSRGRVLPPDTLISDDLRDIWRLSTGDWEKLSSTTKWDQNQRAFLKLLQEMSNGPIHVAEAREKGIDWGSTFVKRFNKVLRIINDFDNPEGGSIYHLRLIAAKTHCYSIRKLERVQSSKKTD